MSERITMPQLGETVTEGTILRWLVNVGDSIKEDDPILEISTDKVDTEVPSPFSGTVSALLVEEGETVEVGSPLLELDGENSSEDVTNDTNDVVEEVVDAPTDQNPVQEIVENKEVVEEDQPITKVKNIGKVSPVVRRLASENNIDLESVQGTGKDGRVTRKDIDHFINNGSGKISSQTKPSMTQSKSAEIGTSEIPRLRKKIAENMILSKQTSAHVMTSVEVDFENVENIRSKVKNKFKEENNFSLTYLPFIATAVVSALREHSVVNSSFDLEKGVHTVHENIELGIAVDINQDGLLVGTIREADSYNLKGTARKISEISSLFLIEFKNIKAVDPSKAL